MEILFPAAVALAVQVIKNYFGTSEYKTLAVVFVLSLVAAIIYTTLVAAGYWTAVLNIMTVAGAIYTYILARFEK